MQIVRIYFHFISGSRQISIKTKQTVYRVVARSCTMYHSTPSRSRSLAHTGMAQHRLIVRQLSNQPINPLTNLSIGRLSTNQSGD